MPKQRNGTLGKKPPARCSNLNNSRVATSELNMDTGAAIAAGFGAGVAP